MRILIAEDDAALASFLRKGLEAEYHATDIAKDGADAMEKLQTIEYDLMVLDLNLPKVDGVEVLKLVRTKRAGLLIIVLTARNRVEDRVETLDLGADDYLVKPFSFSELSARVRALLRRSKRPYEAMLSVGDLTIDRIRRTVMRGAKPVALSPKEFALLEYLMLNAGRVITRAVIIDRVWNLSSDTMTNVVDVYINYLRKKIDYGHKTKLIHTIRGAGYQISVEGENLLLIKEDIPDKQSLVNKAAGL